MSDEDATRSALAWAIDETALKLPPMLRQVGGWQWDGDDKSLFRLRDEGEFRFHVASERRRAGKARIAVMSIADDDGMATWEALMPAEAAS